MKLGRVVKTTAKAREVMDRRRYTHSLAHGGRGQVWVDGVEWVRKSSLSDLPQLNIEQPIYGGPQGRNSIRS